MKPWKLVITKWDNGWTVKDANDGDDEFQTRIVVQDREWDADTIHDLLWVIMETLGYHGSRHDKRRCRVRIEHGDKFECEDSRCEICKG